MRALWITTLAASIALCAPLAHGQNAPLEARTVVDSVQSVLPTLIASERERDAANAELLAAEGGFDPTLRARANLYPLGYYRYGTVDAIVEQPTPLWGTSLFVGYRIGAPLVQGSAGIPDYYGGQQTNSAGEIRAGVAIPLLRNGPIDRRRANVQVRSQGTRIADADLERARIDATRGATTRYWEWVAAGQKLEIARDLLRVARERNDGLQVRATSGDLAQYEVLDNTRSVLSRESSVVSATQGLQRAAIELSLFYRDREGQTILATEAMLPQSIPGPDAVFTLAAGDPAREAEALRNRPEMRRFDAQLAQARTELEVANNQMLPQVDLVAQVSQDFGSSFSMSDTRYRTEVSAGVTIEVPIVMRQQFGRRNAAQANVARLDAQRAFLRDRIAADVRDAAAALRAALERTQLTEREVQVARQVEQAERERFRQGDSNIFLVNQREQARAEAEVRRVDAITDWLRARAAFRAAMGER